MWEWVREKSQSKTQDPINQHRRDVKAAEKDLCKRVFDEANGPPAISRKARVLFESNEGILYSQEGLKREGGAPRVKTPAPSLSY